MSIESDERWASDDGDTLVGRPAAPKVHGLRPAHPIRARFARLLNVHTDGRASNRGADGELVTGWWLGRLPDGWRVIHDVSVGDACANVEHLVIGPAGVFTIGTKNLT